MPALPNKRFEPTKRPCMLTPEVVEGLSVFNFGLIISQSHAMRNELVRIAWVFCKS